MVPTSVIKANISKKHNELMKNIGQIPYKFSFDYSLLLNRMFSHLSSVIKCFSDENIIDTKEIISGVESGDCIGIRIGKNGFKKHVYIWSDGYNISVKSSNYPLISGLDLDHFVCYNVNVDDYDWEQFANHLLDFIHKVIYSRLQSLEFQIFKS